MCDDLSVCSFGTDCMDCGARNGEEEVFHGKGEARRCKLPPGFNQDYATDGVFTCSCEGETKNGRPSCSDLGTTNKKVTFEFCYQTTAMERESQVP